jgi:hypothetical protein
MTILQVCATKLSLDRPLCFDIQPGRWYARLMSRADAEANISKNLDSTGSERLNDTGR